MAAQRHVTRGNGQEGETNIRAAVLVPLIERPEGWYVVLTLRAADLADHAGQISFPGGRIEPRIPMRFTPPCARPRKRSACR